MFYEDFLINYIDVKFELSETLTYFLMCENHYGYIFVHLDKIESTLVNELFLNHTNEYILKMYFDRIKLNIEKIDDNTFTISR